MGRFLLHLLLCVLIAFVRGQFFGTGETHELDTPMGRLRGEMYLLPDGSQGTRFLGIPFAQPPTGELRFKAPVPLSRWEGTKDALTFGPMCVQHFGVSFWDSEEEKMWKDAKPLSRGERSSEMPDIESTIRQKRDGHKEPEAIGAIVSNLPSEYNDILEKSHLENVNEEKSNLESRKEKESEQTSSENVVDYENSKAENNSRLVHRERYLHLYNTSEDCLNLNVYVPSKSHYLRHNKNGSQRNKQWPVIVYIHGGSYFLSGSRIYPGEKLASIGAIVVTFNYRLGPLGFLSTGDSHAYGNWGLLDQRLALLWVQKNIEVFGGDKKKVLLIGNSAGASSALLHLVSPMSKGLFSRVAALSGCSLAPWAVHRYPIRPARNLASLVGCQQSPSDVLVQCLRRASVEDIINAFSHMAQDGMWLSFTPVIDRRKEGFLPEDPYKLIIEGKHPNIPLLMTLTRDEVSIWFENHQKELPLLEIESWMDMIIQNIYTDLEKDSLASISHAVRAEYIYGFGYDPEGEGTENVSMKTISNLISDIGLRVPCTEEANLLSHNLSLYLAEFVYASPDDARIYNQNWIGAYHESDLIYMFGQPYFKFSNSFRHPHDLKISQTLMEIFYSFAEYGVPKLKGQSWWPYTEANRTHLEIGKSVQVKNHFMSEKLCFWKKLIPLFTKWRIKPVVPASSNCYIFSVCARSNFLPQLCSCSILVLFLSLVCAMLG